MRGALPSVLALIVAVGVAFAVASMIDPPSRLVAAAPDAGVEAMPPSVKPVVEIHVPEATHERAIPPEVAAQADVLAAPWAPGIRLRQTTMTGKWPERRALIEDMTTGDVRAYAIGDLLPHGSLLVGISTTTADIMVSDRELVRLNDDGTLGSLEDFADAKAPPAGRARRAGRTPPEFREAANEAIDALRADDPELVQAAIDALVDAGDPMAELLMRHVASIYPVVRMTYAVPTGGHRTVAPEVQGDLVIAILEEITAQTFGDPTAASAGERREIVDRWKRWWGD